MAIVSVIAGQFFGHRNMSLDVSAASDMDQTRFCGKRRPAPHSSVGVAGVFYIGTSYVDPHRAKTAMAAPDYSYGCHDVKFVFEYCIDSTIRIYRRFVDYRNIRDVHFCDIIYFCDEKSMNLVVHTDGGARGNPGPAAVGVVVEKDGVEIISFGKRIGETTNNVAEYTAVVEALHCVKNNLPRSGISLRETIIKFYLDSTLVVNQLNGLFKIKEPHLRELMFAVRQLEHDVGGVITYSVVRREFNKRADFFVNKALDS